MNLQLMDESNKQPIVTTMETTTIDKVPFPAITINRGGILDPWGYTTKACDSVPFPYSLISDILQALGLLIFEKFGNAFDENHPSQKLRNDFYYLFEGVVKAFSDRFKRTYKYKLSVEEIKSNFRNHYIFLKRLHKEH